MHMQVYRDKSGKRVTLQELKAQQEASKKPVAETPEWGSGMAQKREAEERRKQLQAEAAKPFARTRQVKHVPVMSSLCLIQSWDGMHLDWSVQCDCRPSEVSVTKYAVIQGGR